MNNTSICIVKIDQRKKTTVANSLLKHIEKNKSLTKSPTIQISNDMDIDPMALSGHRICIRHPLVSFFTCEHDSCMGMVIKCNGKLCSQCMTCCKQNKSILTNAIQSYYTMCVYYTKRFHLGIISYTLTSGQQKI